MSVGCLLQSKKVISIKSLILFSMDFFLLVPYKVFEVGEGGGGGGVDIAVGGGGGGVDIATFQNLYLDPPFKITNIFQRRKF